MKPQTLLRFCSLPHRQRRPLNTRHHRRWQQPSIQRLLAQAKQQRQLKRSF